MKSQKGAPPAYILAHCTTPTIYGGNKHMLETLTPKQVAEILHTTEAGLAQMRYRGIGPKFSKCGAKVLYLAANVEAFLVANTCQRTDDPRGAAR